MIGDFTEDSIPDELERTTAGGGASHNFNVDFSMDTGVAMIIGCGNGLGAPLARRFAKAGLNIGVASRNKAELRQIHQDVDKLGAKAVCVPCKHGKFEELKSAIEQVESVLGNITVLIYNVGDYYSEEEIPMNIDEWGEGMEIGEYFKAGVAAADVAARKIIPNQLKAGKGTILITLPGDNKDIRGSKNYPGFAMAKYGLRSLSQWLSRDLKPKGIHVARVVVGGLVADKGKRARMSLDETAEVYWQLHSQPKGQWTHEVDLRDPMSKL